MGCIFFFLKIVVIPPISSYLASVLLQDPQNRFYSLTILGRNRLTHLLCVGRPTCIDIQINSTFFNPLKRSEISRTYHLDLSISV